MVPSPVVRTCVGCRARDSRTELIRLVAGEDSHGPAVVPDPRRVAPGRGAHLHPTTDCLALAVRRRALPRALRVAGTLSTETLREHLEHHTSTDRPN